MSKEDYKAIFETLQLEEKTLAIGHGETITPPTISSNRPIDPMESLPRFKMAMKAAVSDADFQILDTLGEGGMGLVSLAEQKALRRLVAVKEPKGADARAHGQVLDEALVMGRMEHPNVVPAYSLGRREDGQPILVMKRVEGTSWEDVLAGDADPPGGGEADRAWHLRVLLQVCNALRFAHARRVVHRDIKPENVMIGEFGEVYLLDWGIAFSLEAEVDHGLPTTETARGFAGTPAFMAPEMTNDDPSDIDERTDVYLLGANLHMVLTGEPPHSGTSLFEVCRAAFHSEPPEYDDETPSELAAIARKAMAPEKDDRYPSVAAFAEEVTDWLEHRASYTLSDDAHEILQEVRDSAESAESPNRLLEAEFGFRQALKIWKGNDAARRGLQETVEERVRSCIEREELGGARAALEQLPQENEELAAQVEALASELEKRAERVDYLERFEQELDLKTATRSRQRVVITVGIAFVVLCALSSWGARPGQPEAPVESWMYGYWRLLAISAGALALFWKKLLANVANRRIVGFVITALVALFMLRFAAVRVEPPDVYILIAEICVMGMAAFAVGIATSRRLAAISAVYAGAVLAAILSEQLWIGYIAFGIAHAVFFGSTAWIWRPSATRD